jgi:hypothetical protein
MYKSFDTHWPNGLTDIPNYIHRCNLQQGVRGDITTFGCIHAQTNDQLTTEQRKSACYAIY